MKHFYYSAVAAVMLGAFAWSWLRGCDDGDYSASNFHGRW